MHRASYFLLAALIAGCGGDEFAASQSPSQPDAGSPDAPSTDAPQDVATSNDAKAEAATEAGPKPDAGKDAQPHEAGLDAAVSDVVSVDAIVTCSNQQDREVSAEADGAIFKSACNGANSYTNGPHANVGLGRGLLRFALGSELAPVFATPGKVLELALVLQRNKTCENEGNCPAAAGQLSAYPLVNDWVEGNGTDYSGADWCRKGASQNGAQWQTPGADGANDHGALAGTATVDAVQESVTITLLPARFSAWVGNDGHLSILLVPELATFVFATHESNMYSPPRLIIKYCE